MIQRRYPEYDRNGQSAQGRIIYAWELPSIMRKHIVTGAMGTIYFFLLSGMYLVAFGNDLGMNYWHWGVLGASASFTQLLQLASAHFVRLSGNRKTLWYFSALTGRVLRGMAIVLAFALLDYSPAGARAGFMILLVLSNCCDAVASPPWFSWLADIIPEKEHGRFMGRRSAWIAMANAVAMMPIGYMVDHYGQDSLLPALMAVFAIGFLFGLSDLIIHRTIPEPPLPRGRGDNLRDNLTHALSDPHFRPWLMFNGSWTFSMTLGGTLATVYFVENLGIRRSFFGGSIVLLLVPLLGTALMGRWLGTLVDRHGFKAVLQWGHRAWALLPLFWLVATPRTALLFLGAGSLVAGLGSEAALTASTKFLTRSRPPDEVPMYVAASTCVGALAGGVGALAAGFLLRGMKGMEWQFGDLQIIGFHVVFILSFLLRTLSTTLIRRI